MFTLEKRLDQGATASMQTEGQQVEMTVLVISLLKHKYVPEPAWSFASLSSKYI